MKFTFSIRNAIKESWQSFARHPLFFGAMAFVMVIFNLFTRQHNQNGILFAVVSLAALLWSYVWISVSLAAVDRKEDVLDFKALSVHMPTLRQFLMFLAISIVVGLIVGVGFILIIIPGIYFMTRLMFANVAYVDRQGSFKQSFQYSWHLVKGKIFWTALLVLIVEVALIMLGTIAFLIGILITYPLAMMLIAHLYRALQAHQRQHKTHEAPAQ